VEVSLVHAICETDVEVVDLPPAVDFHLPFLITVGQGAEILLKLWRPKILRITITVILEMFRDFGL
jgi:hypothetical protein